MCIRDSADRMHNTNTAINIVARRSRDDIQTKPTINPARTRNTGSSDICATVSISVTRDAGREKRRKSNIKASRNGVGIASIETNSHAMMSASSTSNHWAKDCDVANRTMSGMNNAAPRTRRRVPDGEAATIPESDRAPSVSQ